MKGSVERLEKKLIRAKELLALSNKLVEFHPVFGNDRTLFYEHYSYVTPYQGVGIFLENDTEALSLFQELPPFTSGIFQHTGYRYKPLFAPVDHTRSGLEPTPFKGVVACASAFVTGINVTDVKLKWFTHVGGEKLEISLYIADSNVFPKAIGEKRRHYYGGKVGNYFIEEYFNSHIDLEGGLCRAVRYDW